MEQVTKRRHEMKLRLSSLEKRVIEKKAAEAGMSTAAYCRSAALGQSLRYRLSEEEVAAYELLVKYHNNFQRIGNLLRNKDSAFAKEVAQTAREIREHIQKFR